MNQKVEKMDNHTRPTLFLLLLTVLTPADQENHVDKHPFKVPFVCGARNLGEALRRISEGAAMIRTKGEAGTGVLYYYPWSQIYSEIILRK